MKYSIDTWIKVLETLRYKIGDEMSKAGSDINIDGELFNPYNKKVLKDN